MIRKKITIAAVLILTGLLIFAAIFSNELMLNYNMHKETIYAGFNDLFLSESDINEYISDNQEFIDVIHYDLEINLYPSEKMIKGEAEISMVFKDKSLKNIELNFYDNMEIEKVLLNGKKSEYIFKDSKVIIDVPADFPDTNLVYISYSGSPRNIGMSSFSFTEKDSSSVIYTLNEPIYASTWFPCNDKPDDKALLDIKITNDKQFTSVSNGKLVDEKINGERKTYHWKTNYPISTYLITINSAEYLQLNETYISETDSMDLNYFVFREDSAAAVRDFRKTLQMLKVFSNLFGEYPFIKEKYGIVEFLWQSGAMEHQTITGIGSNFVSGYDLHQDILIHELAHQWWGNAVGPKSWKDIWLNEGFATYSEALFFEAESGASALQSTMINNKDFNDSRLYNPDDGLFSTTVYDKGAWVLHMLRRLTGDETFFNILKKYYQKYKFKNASTKDFIAVCEETYGKSLKRFFNQWVYEGHDRPEIETSLRQYMLNGKNITEISIKQNQSNLFEFPLDFSFYGKEKVDLSFMISTRDTLISLNNFQKTDKYEVDPQNWLLADFIKDND